VTNIEDPPSPKNQCVGRPSGKGKKDEGKLMLGKKKRKILVDGAKNGDPIKHTHITESKKPNR